ncbi:MAG: hypothetical protein IJ343_14100 [Clostridia bacterium]|nr:hypothetical protein [Clostridia bacterium]
MKYEKATAVVVEFDNSDVVTASLGNEFACGVPSVKVNGVSCGQPSIDAYCGISAFIEIGGDHFGM